MKSTLKIIFFGFLSGVAGSFVFNRFLNTPDQDQAAQVQPTAYNVMLDSPESFDYSAAVRELPETLDMGDFSYAASRAIPSVVYINSIAKGVSTSYWDWFFGNGSGSQTQVSSGSGVIFTSNGYIVTNNHVIASAEKIEVIYNKRSYVAELVGTDPSTDLAVLKIEESNLPAIAIGSAKNVQVGEWVVAVGNPFSLSSTVTAGIVSAKGRRIGILEDKFPIESFIQTDAAINPGNSGGALVNKNGELVGINTAILSRTGSYTGYAFAVPVDIARKVVDDLVKHGIVQKAFLGGGVVEFDYQNAKKFEIENVRDYNGVLLDRVEKDGPAAMAGMKRGDIITRIDNMAVNSISAFEEEIAYRNPGDKISVTYLRNAKSYTTSLTLVNRNGTTDLIKRKIITSASLGAQLEATEYGVKVFKIRDNSPLKQIGVNENFTIIALNRVRIKDPEEVIDFFEKFRGRGSVYGINSSRQQIEIPFSTRQ